MLEAMRRVCDHYGLGSIIQIGDDYTETDKGIWCHVLSPKRILAIQHSKNMVVNYTPHPFFYVKAKKPKTDPAFCLLLYNKDENLSEEVMILCRYFLKNGVRVNRIDNVDLTTSERLRSFREASFILAVHCSTGFSQISLCASATPFLLMDKPSSMTESFVQLANVEEAIQKNATVETIQELFLNKDNFEKLVTETTLQMSNLRSWKNNIYNKERFGNNDSYFFAFDDRKLVYLTSCSNRNGILFVQNSEEIFSSNKVLLTPWIGYVRSEDFNNSAFQVSLISCFGILVDNTSFLNKIESFVRPIPVVVLPFPIMQFNIQKWRQNGKQAYVTCKDGSAFVTTLETLSSKTVKKYTPRLGDVVVSEYTLPWKLMKSFILNSIPFVCPFGERDLPDLMEDYPGFLQCSYTPKKVKAMLTDELLTSIVAHIGVMQYKLFYNKLKETAIYANCASVM